jgi:hypothetical protein
VKYELGFYIPEDDILHSRRRENLKSYTISCVWNVANCSANGEMGSVAGATFRMEQSENTA